MTIDFSADVFQTVDSEHQELERQYAAFDAFLEGESARVAVLRRQLAELTGILKAHFAREEEEGYFAEIVILAPRLSHTVEELELEHDSLLARLDYLDDQLSTTDDTADELAKLRQEFGDLIESCRAHEHRETALVQEAWLTEIGAGD